MQKQGYEQTQVQQGLKIKNSSQQLDASVLVPQQNQTVHKNINFHISKWIYVFCGVTSF